MPLPAHPTLIVFDKDGVLLDLNATWMPLIIGIADYLSGRVDGSIDRDALLAAVGVEMVPGTDQGRILENSVFAAGTFVAMREIWQEMSPALAPVFADLEGYRAAMQQIGKKKCAARPLRKVMWRLNLHACVLPAGRSALPPMIRSIQHSSILRIWALPTPLMW